MATTDMNAQIHIKDGNGNVNNIFPATKIANVEGLTSALNAKADTTTVNNQLSGKVDKETGKGLSTNDYTTAEKNKLAGIEAQANKTVVDSALSSTSTNPVQNKVINTALGNKADASTVSALATTVNGKADASSVSSLSSQVSTNTSNIATQTARIDAIAALPSGSTSGDAELIDIRTKIDGTTATNAGTAVRDQVNYLKTNLINKEDNGNLFDIKSFVDDASASTYYSIQDDTLNVNSQDARAEGNMKYRVYLKAGVEYVITTDYVSNQPKMQIYDPDNRRFAYNDVIDLWNTFTPTYDGYYTIKVYYSYGASYPGKVTNIYLGKKADWINSKNGRLVVHKPTTEINGSYAINRAMTLSTITGITEIYVPYNASGYELSDSIRIKSGVTLIIAKNTNIKLGDNVNKPMIVNDTQSTASDYDSNISVIGGIWNGNHEHQQKWSGSQDGQGNIVVGFWFTGVSNLTLKEFVLKNTRTYAMIINNVYDMTIANAEISGGNAAVHRYDNGDGIHICGPARLVKIRDCVISSDDNAIALDCDLGRIHSNPESETEKDLDTIGDIVGVTIDNVVISNPSDGQGMLMLASKHTIRNVTLNNISGTAPYFLVLDHWDADTGYSGTYENITLNNIKFAWNVTGVTFSFINLIGHIKGLNIDNVDLDVYTNSNADIDNIISIKERRTGDTTVEDLYVNGVVIDRKNATSSNWKLLKGSNSIIKTAVLSNVRSNDAASKLIPVLLSGCTCKAISLSNSYLKTLNEYGYAKLEDDTNVDIIVLSDALTETSVTNNVTVSADSNVTTVKAR